MANQKELTIEEFGRIMRGYTGDDIQGKDLTDQDIFILYHRRKLPAWIHSAEKRGIKVLPELKVELINKAIGG